jgi:N-acetylmuramoyl-L-alanine amidase
MSSKYHWLFLHIKRIFSFLLICIGLTLFQGERTKADERPSAKLRRIVIDAGHGGKDPGSIGKHIREKDVALAIALKFGNYIKTNLSDVEVIYTRDEDVFVELGERANIANKNDADLFVSIHANSNTNKEAFGTETFAMGLKTDDKNFEVAKKENSVIVYEDDYTTKYEGFDPNSPESYIVFSLMQNKFLEQSLNFASHIQDEFRDRIKRTDRGVKQAGFLVLWRTSMPSVLVETGFVSNPDEEKFLISEEGQDLIASGIFRAFKKYKDEIEMHSSYGKEHIQITNSPVEVIQEEDTSIQFRVQLTSSAQPLQTKSKYFEKIRLAFPDSTIDEFQFNGMNKYTIGISYDYKTASGFAREVKKRWPDAFVVAVKNRKIVPLSDVLNRTDQ